MGLVVSVAQQSRSEHLLSHRSDHAIWNTTQHTFSTHHVQLQGYAASLSPESEACARQGVRGVCTRGRQVIGLVLMSGCSCQAALLVPGRCFAQ
eukprot:10521969-Alexandrium_andersonii.AAC.1